MYAKAHSNKRQYIASNHSDTQYPRIVPFCCCCCRNEGPHRRSKSSRFWSDRLGHCKQTYLSLKGSLIKVKHPSLPDPDCIGSINGNLSRLSPLPAALLCDKKMTNFYNICINMINYTYSA